MSKEARNKAIVLTLAKRFFVSFLIASFFVGAGYAGLRRVSAATAPRIVMYQGRLLNANNVPVADTTATMSFALYNSLSGGTCLWSNNSSTCASIVARSVTLSAGLFSESLGDTDASYAAISATVFSSSTSIYLEVIVNGETLTPRKRMLAAPFALNSDALNGYGTTLFGATSSAVPVFNGFGNLVITGSPQSTAFSGATLLLNPATGEVGANEVLFGVGVSNLHRFTLDAEGDILMSGSEFAGSGAITLSSGGSGNLILNAGGGVVSVMSGVDFSVGANTIVSPFSVDSSLQTVRFGAGSGADPRLDFFASNGTSNGQIVYNTNDEFYFSNSRMQIDSDGTPNAPALSTGKGDLFVAGNIENLSSVSFGSAASVNAELLFTSGKTANPARVILGSLQTGTGFLVSRADSVTDLTGTLFEVAQLDSSSGTTGTAALIQQLGTGSAIGLRIVQGTTSAHVSDSTGNTALVIDVLENRSSDDAIILRSDADGDGGVGTNIEFRVTSQGDAYADGAFSGAGADFAEYFPTTDSSLKDSMIACLDVARNNSVRACSSLSQNIAGVLSTNPAFIGNLVGDGTEDLRGNSAYRLVGLVGQIDTYVSADHGAIAIGDPIALSSTLSGYGAKAIGPARIVGYALQPLLSGSGKIRVLVQPHWYAGNVLTQEGSATQVGGSLAIAALTRASSAMTTVDSASLELRGSAWNGSSAETVAMGLRTTVNAVDDYRLAVTNGEGVSVAAINRSGDFALAGKFYPSDRGAMQESAYIYYDGSAGIGGNFMRTNASGWATGSYDFAEMFPSADALIPGEIVVFGDESQTIKRSVGEIYSRTIAGVVSTRPGFLAGENRAGNYPIALAGRVPTNVSTENGEIHIGDPLTTSSRPGYAMKATEPGPIVGYAAESFTGALGTVVTYINVSYYSGAPVETAPGADNTISQLADDISNFDTAGVLHFNGGQLFGIGTLVSASGAWRLESNGDFLTSGRFISLIESSTGASVETYATTSRETMVQLSGTVNLVNGRAEVRFADVDPAFSSITDPHPSYRALVTPYGATGSLYVTNRTVDGFDIVESGTASTGIAVDWMVLAYRRDFAPAVQVPADVISVPEFVPDNINENAVGASTEEETAIPEEEIAAPDLEVVPDSEVISGGDSSPITDEATPVDDGITENSVPEPSAP